LAVKLGKVNVERDILRALTAKQFRGWEHFEELYPSIGEERLDYRLAAIVQMLYNINRGKDQKALSIQDFLLFAEKEKKPEQTPEQKFKILQLWAAAMANDGPPLAPQETDAIVKARAATK